MKKCSYCGRENDDLAVFCAGCGTDQFCVADDLAAPSPPVSPRTTTALVLGIGVLGLAAFFMSYIAGTAHPDSPQDTAAGKLTSWSVIGPLWTSVVFLFATLYLQGRRRATVYAVTAAIITWVCIGWAFSAMEDYKVRARHRYHKPPATTKTNVPVDAAGAISLLIQPRRASAPER